MLSGQEKKEIGAPGHYPPDTSLSSDQIDTWLGMVSQDGTQRTSLCHGAEMFQEG